MGGPFKGCTTSSPCVLQLEHSSVELSLSDSTILFSMDPNILVSDRLVETVQLPTQRWYRSEEEKKKFFMETSNEFLSGFSKEMDNCVNIYPQMVDIFKVEKQKIVEEFREFFGRTSFIRETKKMNLRLHAFGELARTVSIPREMKNGVDLDLFAALGFANTPKVKKYATKIQKFLSLLCKRLFHDGTLLEGRRVQKANQPEKFAIIFVIDGISTRLGVYINNSSAVPYKASQLISVYEQYDSRFLSLCAFIHFWFAAISSKLAPKSKKSEQMIPSLSKIALLVVYFLQHYGIFPPAGLLHEDAFMEYQSATRNTGHGYIQLVKKEFPPGVFFTELDIPSANSAVLFLMFCDFYTEVVPLNQMVLELGSHSTIPKQQFKSHIQNLLLFRDVFDDISPGSRVSNVSGLTLLLKAGLRLAKERLERFRFDLFTELKNIDLDELTNRKTASRNEGFKKYVV